jgi:Tol biopolymer transport system component/predicted Ser/Thr protein kinase
MIGQHLGHFRILERLGSGGMGVVYRAHDEKLQRSIAIKVVGRDTATPDTDRPRIVEEARAASGLNHPHICTVYETGEVDGLAYIAMEYVEGRTLAELIGGSGLPPETVVRYGMQIADALAHAHSRGVIHRDLKTSNVVVSSEGRAKVLDFGLARRIPLNVGTDLTRSSNAIADGKLVGTLAYMAPEMLLGQTADERSDIWGLGVMLHEMCAGALPFQGRNEFELTAAILRSPAELLPPHVPPMLRAIIVRCLAKEPAQRYQHAMEVRAALEAIQSGAAPLTAPIEHVAPSAVEPLAEQRVRPRRSTRSFAAIGVGAVLLVIAAGALAWYRTTARSPWERVATGGRLTLVVASDEPLIDPAISLDSKMLAYVAVGKDGTTDVFVRRVAGGGLVRVTNDPAREASPRFSPDGERVAFARRESAEGTPEIRIVPALGGDAVTTIAGAVEPRWSPDGKQLAFLRPTPTGETELVVANGDGSNPHPLLQPNSVFPFLRDPAWSPDNREIAIVRGSGGIAGEIWFVPLDGSDPRKAIDDPPEVFSDSPAYTSDGLGLVHSSNRGGATNIWFYPRRGGAPVRLTAGAGPDAAPTTAEDGTIAFINSRWRNTLEVYNIRGGQPKVLTTHSPYLWGPAFSPDGRTIAFSRSEVDGSWHLWTMPADGGPPKRLTDSPSGEVYSRFSNDGAFLMFHTWSTPRRIGRVPSGGGAAQLLDFGGPSDAFADMSRDGRWIAFTRIEQDAERIYIVPAAGGKPRLLTSSAGAVPRWSPDGKLIAFSSSRSLSGGIVVIEPDGRNERRLTTTGGWPVWFPDGQQLAFLVAGKNGHQEIQTVSRTGAPGRPIAVDFNGFNHPFDISRDGSRIATTNAVHVSDEVWILEPK